MAEQLYHLHQDGQQITAAHDPVSIDHINNKYGGMKALNNANILATDASKTSKISKLKKTLIDAKSIHDLKERYSQLIKGKRSADSAFVDIGDLEYKDKEENQDDKEEEPGQEGQEGEGSADQSNEEAQPEQDGQQEDPGVNPEDQGADQESGQNGQETDPEADFDQEANPRATDSPEGQPVEQDQEGSQDDVQEDAPVSAAAGEQEDVSDDPKMSHDEVSEHLKNEGYTDSEIKYILHGDVPYIPSKDDHAADNTLKDGAMDRDHQSVMNDIDQEKAQADMPNNEDVQSHARAMMDHELSTAKYDKYSKQADLEHKQAILLMEREFEQKSKELDLKYKEMELGQKMKHSDKDHQTKNSHTSTMNKLKASQSADAAKTSQKELKGKS